jgi:argininosuccinate lyase
VAHLWSGRFAAEPDAGVFAFGASFSFDRRLFPDDVRGSLAWAAALREAGVLSGEEAAVMIRGLEEILEAGTSDPAWVDGPDEDVHSFVERILVERVGATGKRLHTGRSRNEQVALDLRLYVLRRVPALQQAIATLVRAFLDQAERAGDAVMPGYTHLRRAQPVLVAHYWLSHAVALRRDHVRLGAARDEADALPLGSGALAGSSYDVNTAALAAGLGFSRVASNSLDAVGDRDFVSSFLHAATLTLLHLSRLAEDVIVFGTEEFGFFELDDRVATGSSLMPQKKNPDPLELIRAKSGRIAGRLSGWIMTMKGLPSGYNKDLQEDKEALFDADDTLAAALAAATTVVDTLTVRFERLARAAGGLLLATDVADFLVARGMPFRSAHEVVGAIVRRLADEDRDFASLSVAEWQAFSPLFDERVRSTITARASIEARRTPQSTAPASVAGAIEETRAWVAATGLQDEPSRI